jgi:hypothetical protein
MIPKMGGFMFMKNPPLRWVHDQRKSQHPGAANRKKTAPNIINREITIMTGLFEERVVGAKAVW